MKPQNAQKLLVSGLILLFALACNGTFTAAFPTPTGPSPTETYTAIPSLAPPTPQVTLSSVSFHEENQATNYQIQAEIPTLQGSADANIVNFNTTMTNLVNTEINEFKKNVSKLPLDSVPPDSILDITHALILQSGDLWSLKFDFSVYLAGAAHPYHYSLTVNYDLAQGRQLALSDLFLPSSNYLEVISNYCVADLSQRDIGFDGVSGGALPTPENYRNWNITTDGLRITFDQYQVAAGAAGAQTVLMPYDQLQAVIDPEGLLAAISR